MRRSGRIVSVAVIIAAGVNSDGRREVLGMEIGCENAPNRDPRGGTVKYLRQLRFSAPVRGHEKHQS